MINMPDTIAGGSVGLSIPYAEYALIVNGERSRFDITVLCPLFTESPFCSEYVILVSVPFIQPFSLSECIRT